ncbi:MAG: MFS transporter [Candidatus Helarchaeota archaeon]
MKNKSIFLLISAFIISVSTPAFFIFMLNKAGVYYAPLLVSIYFLHSLIFSYIFGRLSDKFNIKKLLILIGFISSCVLYLLVFFVIDFISMLIIAALIGISHSIWTPLLIAVFTSMEIKMASGKQAAVINSMYSFGWAIGSIIGGFIEEFSNLNSVFIFLSLIGFTSLIPVLLIKNVENKHLKSIHTNGEKGHLNSHIPNYHKTNYNQIIILLIICISLRFLCSQGAVIGLLPNFLEYELQINPSLKGIVLSINMITQCILIIPLGFLIDKFGKKVILFLSLLGSGMNSIFYGLSYLPWHIIPNQILIGFSYSAIVASSTAIIKDITDHNKFGEGMGINNMSRSIGGMSGPFLAFFLINISYSFAFYILGVFGILSALILAIFLKENRKKNLFSIRFFSK